MGNAVPIMRVLSFFLLFIFGSFNANSLTEKEKKVVYNLSSNKRTIATDLTHVNSVDWLEQQARLAELISRDDIVESTLERLLAIEAKKPEVLAIHSRLLVRQNQKVKAQQISSSLTSEFPNHIESKKLQQYLAIYGADSGRYSQVKILQMGGRIDEALNVYKTLFPNGFPTLSIQLDYLNLAGKKDENWPYVKDELEQLNLANRQVALLQFSLATHISRRYPGNVWANKTLQRLALNSLVGERAALTLLDNLANKPISADWATQHAILASYFPRNSKVQLANKYAQTGWDTEQVLLKDPRYRAKLQGLRLLESEKNNDINKAYDLLKYAKVARPNDPQILEGLGKYYLKYKQSGKAISYFKQALAIDEDVRNRSKYKALILTGQYWEDLRQGDKLLQAGQTELARNNYLSAYNRDKTELDAQISLGQLYLLQGSYQQAEPWFWRVLLIEPAQKLALEGMVEIKRQQQGDLAALNYAQSLCRRCQTVLASSIDNLKVKVKLAKIRTLVAEQQDKQALQAIDELSALTAIPPWSCKEIADQLVVLAEEQRAFKFIENCQDSDKSEDMLFAYGLFLSQQGQEVKALSTLKSIPDKQRSVAVNNTIKRINLDLQLEKIQQTQLTEPQKSNALLIELQKNISEDYYTQLRVASTWVRFNKPQQAKKIIHALPITRLLNDDYLFAGQVGLRAEDNDYVELLLTDAKQRDFTTAQKLAFDKLIFDHQFSIAEQEYNKANFQQAQQAYGTLYQIESEHKSSVAIGLAKASQALGDEPNRNMAILHLKTHSQQLTYEQHQQLVAILYDSGDKKRANTELTQLSKRRDGSVVELSRSFDLAIKYQQWSLSEKLAKQTLKLDRFDIYTDEYQQELSLKYLYKNADDYWLTQNIKSDLAKLHAREQGAIKFGIDYAFSEGSYNNLHIPLEIVLPFSKYDGHLLAKAEVALIDSDESTYYDTQQKLNQKDRGIDFGIGWLAENWQFDIGISPQGFEENNVVGGITISQSLGGFTLRPAISRRVDINGVISEQWGANIETRASLGLSWDQGGSAGFWASAQFSELMGKNIYDNDRKALLGGTYYRLIAEDSIKLNIGMNVFTMSFDKNLSENLVGHGGYYSPQRYFSVSVPVTFSGRYNQDLSYSLFGSASYSWTELDAPYGIIESSSDGGGFGVSLEGLVEKKIAAKWNLGAMFRLGYSDTNEPHQIQFYVKYLFNESWDSLPIPPKPIELYSNY